MDFKLSVFISSNVCIFYLLNTIYTQCFTSPLSRVFIRKNRYFKDTFINRDVEFVQQRESFCHLNALHLSLKIFRITLICEEKKMVKAERIDLEAPLWDQNTFAGRFKHFAWVTDFRTCVTPEEKLIEAKNLLKEYR